MILYDLPTQDARDSVGFLSAVKLLSPLNERQKRELASIAVEKSYAEGTNIICEGARDLHSLLER